MANKVETSLIKSDAWPAGFVIAIILGGVLYFGPLQDSVSAASSDEILANPPLYELIHDRLRLAFIGQESATTAELPSQKYEFQAGMTVTVLDPFSKESKTVRITDLVVDSDNNIVGFIADDLNELDQLKVSNAYTVADVVENN